jgi:carbamoyl-phosphate synthase large subunit
VKRPITVAITSVRGADSPSPGLVVAQTLRRQTALDVRIVALAADPFAEGLQGLAVADEVVVVRPIDRDPNGFLASVRRLARDRTPIVLIPGSARDVLLLSRHRTALARARVRVLLPAERQLATLPFPPATRRVLVPRHVMVDGREPERAVHVAWRYPATIRWADGVTAEARSRDELRTLLGSREPTLTAGVHARVAGTEIGVASVSAGGGRPGIVAARLLTVSDTGCVWSAVTLANSRVLAEARRILGALRWPGAMETRFVLDARRRLWCVGLVPGFPSWVSLAAAAGRDLVAEYVRLALGLAPTAANGFIEGVLLSRVSVDHPTTVEVLTRLATEGEFRHVPSRH